MALCEAVASGTKLVDVARFLVIGVVELGIYDPLTAPTTTTDPGELTAVEHPLYGGMGRHFQWVVGSIPDLGRHMAGSVSSL